LKKKNNDLKILQITPELTPIAKNGGLADVAGHLPIALSKEFNLEIKIIMPKYDSIDLEKYKAKLICRNMKIKSVDNRDWEKISVWKIYIPTTKIPIYLIDCPKYFSGKGDLYIHNVPKYYQGIPFFHLTFLSKVALEFIETQNWKPDIIHYHDGYEGIISKWLKTIYQENPFYQNIATFVTIHNLGAQQIMNLNKAPKLGLTVNDFKNTRKIYNHRIINMTAEAIYNSDMVNTVSPTYAKEILSKSKGCGLHKLLKSRKRQFAGILNGMDYSNFDPRTNEDTPVKYWIDNLDKKVENKLFLQKKLGLTQSPDLPLICVVSRLTEQKGIDLIDEIIDEIINMGAQFIILGAGEDKIEKMLIKAEKEYPKEIAAELKFDANFAQTIYAGADMILLPSRFEPCGLSQIIAMRFGTIPIVRQTGGLADTVKDGKTGFVFRHYDKQAFLWAIRRAVDVYYNQKDHWRKMQVRCMKKDFSWKASAKKYIWAYKKAVEYHNQFKKIEEN
jgi:starch synthase